MDIKGLDYNTQREPLVMPEYGREIQKMVEHALQLPTRQQRQLCAQTIVRMMESRVPQIRENANYQQTLWDHLYLMSRKQLDIDWPYDMSQAETIHTKPAPLSLPQKPIHLRHYGHLLEQLFEQLKQMPPGAQRDELARRTANQMKRDLAQWGHGSIEDEKVIDDLARLTDGAVQLNLKGNALRRAAHTAEQPQRHFGGKKRK